MVYYFFVLVDSQHSSTCKCWMLRPISCSHFCLSQHGVSNVTDDDHAFLAGHEHTHRRTHAHAHAHSIYVGAVRICHNPYHYLCHDCHQFYHWSYHYHHHYHCHHGSMTTHVGAVPIWGGMRHLGEGAKISVFSQDLAQVSPLLRHDNSELSLFTTYYHCCNHVGFVRKQSLLLT